MSIGSKGAGDFSNLFINVGPNRTGSSIASRLIATFDSMDLVYEPLTAYCLLSLIRTEPSGETRCKLEEIVRVLIVEELFLPKLAGRTINENPHDLSSDLKLLPANVVAARKSMSWSRAKLLEELPGRTLLLKLGDPFVVDLLRRVFPGSRFIMTFRNPFEVAYSVFKRGWFDDEALNANPANVYDTVDGVFTPPWLGVSFRRSWRGMSAVERSCLYAHAALSEVTRTRNALLLSYEDVLERPKQVVELIERFTGCRPSPRTEELIAGIDAGVSAETRRAAYEHVRNSVSREVLSMLEALPEHYASGLV